MIKHFSIVIGLVLSLGLLPVQAADKTADVIIQTEFGDIELQLFPEVAPNHVANFLKLAESGFYDGTLFHRIIPGFMIQGGDPLSKTGDKRQYGAGGPGYNIKAEFNRIRHERGILSMARRSGVDTAGSQFFIMVDKASYLDGQYTVFGKVLKGMEVVDKIVVQRRDRSDIPLKPIPIKMTVVKK